MKYRIGFILLVVGLMFMSCAGSGVLTWRDPSHNLDLMDRSEVYPDQDVKQGGRVYKGLYSRMVYYNDNNRQYKVLANSAKNKGSNLVSHMQPGQKMQIMVGTFQILHATGPSQLCDSSGMWCSSNPGEYTAMRYANPQLQVTLRGFNKESGKQLAELSTIYRYRDLGPHHNGAVMGTTIKVDNGTGIDIHGKGTGIHVQDKSGLWYSIHVEYHDPDNNAGSFIKAWDYTINK
jgi:hypothetical protein